MSSGMIQHAIHSITKQPFSGFVHAQLPIYSQQRGFFFWLTIIFNHVDKKRLKLYGPNRVCAEWLLRNGAAVKFNGVHELTTDYNSLPSVDEGESPQLLVEEICANEASISHYGFNHLIGCNHIRKITFDNCHYLEDKALHQLKHVKDTLRHLEIRNCHNITDKGLLSLTILEQLNILVIRNLSEIKEKQKCEAALRSALKSCKTDYNP